MFFYAVNILAIYSCLFAEESQYDIKIKNGGSFNNCFVKNSKENGTITISDGKSLIEINKSEIESIRKSEIIVDYNLIKEKELQRSNKAKLDRCERNYISSLSDKDLHNLTINLYDKISILRKRNSEIITNNILGTYKPDYINNENEISSYRECLDVANLISKNRESSNTITRGVDAKHKLDKGDFSRPSELEDLVKDKVKMDMLLNR